jgi:hypothetical protein
MARCTLGSLTDKTERHDRTDILLKVALNTISHHHLTYFNKDSCLCLKKIFVFSWCVCFMLKTDSNKTNSIIGVMVSVFASNVVYRWFESLSGHRMWYIVGSSHYRVIECGISFVRVLIGSSNVVYRWIESFSGHRMWYIVGSSPYRVKPMTVRLFFSCFSSKHADLGR